MDYSAYRMGISPQTEVQMSLGSVTQATLLLVRKIHSINANLKVVLPGLYKSTVFEIVPRRTGQDGMDQTYVRTRID